jgi:hypothetical protein
MKNTKQNSSCSTEEDGNSFKRKDHDSGKAEHKAELAQRAEAKPGAKASREMDLSSCIWDAPNNKVRRSSEHETRNPRRSLLSNLSRVVGRLEEETA